MLIGNKQPPPSIQNGADVPATCAICLRKCHALSFHPDSYGKKDWMWICDNPDCISSARTVYMAKQNNLEKYENDAIVRANEKTREELFVAIFMTAHEMRIDKISDITADVMDQILDNATKNGSLIEANRKLLIEYSEAMRDIVKNEIPF